MTHDENRISDLIDGGLHEKSAIDKAKYGLHMRQKAAIEEAATKAWEADARHNPNPNNPYAYRNGFKAGAQTVLDNPQEWFPPVQYWQLRDANERLQSELSRYREALERAYNDFKSSRWTEETYKIVIEALKQQDNDTK